MAAQEGEVRATHEEVEGFVAKLRGFHGSLPESERAMMEVILEGAQAGDTGGYAFKWWDAMVEVRRKVVRSLRSRAGTISSAG